jgi:hypothetical protein
VVPLPVGEDGVPQARRKIGGVKICQTQWRAGSAAAAAAAAAAAGGGAAGGGGADGLGQRSPPPAAYRSACSPLPTAAGPSASLSPTSTHVIAAAAHVTGAGAGSLGPRRARGA